MYVFSLRYTCRISPVSSHQESSRYVIGIITGKPGLELQIQTTDRYPGENNADENTGYPSEITYM